MAFYLYVKHLLPLICLLYLLIGVISAMPKSSWGPRPRLFKRGDIPDPPAPLDLSKDTMPRIVSGRCSPEQVKLEAEGWEEAGILANALYAWEPFYDFQNAMDTYMGTASSSGFGLLWTYRQRVQGAIIRNYNLHVNKQPWRTYIYVYCDEDEVPGHKRCDGSVGAYTWDSIGVFWTNHFVVLCPNQYFNTTRTPSLKDQVQAIRDHPEKAMDMDSLYWNRGSIYHHESFHWEDTVTSPKARDFDPDTPKLVIYGAANVKSEALIKNTYANHLIADAYTMAATAMFLMQTFSLESVPQPGGTNKMVSSKIAALEGTQLDPDSPPDGWVSPQDSNDGNSQPDMTKWQNGTHVALDPADYAPIPPLPTVPKDQKPCPGKFLKSHDGVITCIPIPLGA